MSKVKTIDERIRKAAREELAKEIRVAANNFMRAIKIQGTTDLISFTAFGSEQNRQGVDMFAYNRDLIESITEQAIEKLSQGRENEAISNFIEKVDGLQGQIDDLYADFDQ